MNLEMRVKEQDRLSSLIEVKFLRQGDVRSFEQVDGRPSRVHQVLPVEVAPASSPQSALRLVWSDSADVHE
jgi:hypothetical protein